MVKLIIKIIVTGEEFEIEDFNLDELTPYQLIHEMINKGFLPAGTIRSYGILNKDHVKIDDDELCQSFTQLGFVDGDTVRIIVRGSGGALSVIYPNYFISEFTYESAPQDLSLEDKAQQLAYKKIAMSRLEQLNHEEDRCRAHINRILQGIEKQKHLGTYSSIQSSLFPSVEVRCSSMKRLDSVDKMHDLLNSRLAQLQNSISFFDRFRVSDEYRIIKELQTLLESLETEQKKILRDIEALFQEKMLEVEEKLVHCGIDIYKDNTYFLETFLLEQERELQELVDRKRNIENELDKKREEGRMDVVYSSIFAPAEVKCKSRMLVQVYLHLYEETDIVKALAQESDKDAERRDYIPLQCKLKKGDKVEVQLNIYGETLLMSDMKSVVWQGSFTKCGFDYFVSKDIDANELSCVALLFINGAPMGEMRFITKIVNTPRQLNPEIIAHKYNKVFISYSHQDESKVKFLHEGLELGSVPHFFDRKYLKAGDVFPQVIQDYINTADLFILCWSENASKSEYVQKERLQALRRAFPKVRPEKVAKLRIYPMSIEPRAELPNDMKNYYHFGEI